MRGGGAREASFRERVVILPDNSGLLPVRELRRYLIPTLLPSDGRSQEKITRFFLRSEFSYSLIVRRDCEGNCFDLRFKEIAVEVFCFFADM